MPRHFREPFSYRTPPELAGGRIGQYPVAIVGAGPVGLAAAVDLAGRGVPVIVLDGKDTVSRGSRAICWSKRTLEIFARLGVGARMVEKGVTWQVGRLFHGARELWRFDLLPETGHRMPAFVNLQQYYVEQYLVERAADFPELIDLRWKNRVVSLEQTGGDVRLGVETPDGAYTLDAAWVVACDGAHAPTRAMLGLDFAGRMFEERFLIADVEMQADFPSERWFWFEPPFHHGRSALLHKQPDNIYRIDLQLGPDADPEEEKKPENVVPRIEKMIGHAKFALDWVSVYTFQCRRLERFVHGRVIFAGDSAHVVSPFGARGGNGGIQDVDNLGWKLAMVVAGAAPAALIESYDEERVRAAEENILHSARATAFMTPKSAMERLFRDSVLDLAGRHDFARRLVNSGRLSKPCSLADCALQTPASVAAPVAPGTAMPDAPVVHDGSPSWLLDHFGRGFALLAVECDPPIGLPAHLHVVRVAAAPGAPVAGATTLVDCDGTVAARYGAGRLYLVRPDQHVAAVFGQSDAHEIAAAMARATSILQASGHTCHRTNAAKTT